MRPAPMQFSHCCRQGSRSLEASRYLVCCGCTLIAALSQLMSMHGTFCKLFGVASKMGVVAILGVNELRASESSDSEYLRAFVELSGAITCSFILIQVSVHGV